MPRNTEQNSCRISQEGKHHHLVEYSYDYAGTGVQLCTKSNATGQQQLPTAANLARWKKTSDSSCQLCNIGKPQTNITCPFQLQFVYSTRKIQEATQRHLGDIDRLAG